MIHLIHNRNRHLYSQHLEAMHRQRLEHFIRERGWGLTERDGGEYDEFDDEEAIYLVGFSADGQVAVSCRYRPTHETSLIADIFPHLVAPHEQPIKEPLMYEATRYCAARPYRGQGGFVHRCKLHIATLELMRSLDARRLIGFMDLDFIPYFRRFSGLRIRPIGLPAEYDQGVTLAFEIGVTGGDLDFARQTLRLRTRQLFEAPSWLPVEADPLALAQTTEILINAAPETRRSVLDTVRTTSTQVELLHDVPGLMAELAQRAA